MFKIYIYTLLLVFFVTSCAGTFDSVKRGITGAKKNSTDEFLIEKKDPLILPPDFENLPTPDERSVANEDASIFGKTLDTSPEENSSSSRSVEQSILKQIRRK
mgnify:CR=1 FL=1